MPISHHSDQIQPLASVSDMDFRLMQTLGGHSDGSGDWAPIPYTGKLDWVPSFKFRIGPPVPSFCGRLESEVANGISLTLFVCVFFVSNKYM